MNQEKIYYSISDVAELFDIATSTIRFWEKEIPSLSPQRNKGNRQYTRKDVQKLKVVYHLIKEKGLKIGAVKKQLETKTFESQEINAEIVERLQRIKASLQQAILSLEDEKK